MKTVGELMTRGVACVRTNDSLSLAARLMWERDCGALPVLQQGGDRVLGVITDRDVCMATFMKSAPPSKILVHTAMSKTLFYCAPWDDIAIAEHLMRSKQIRRLPVLDSAYRLHGMLSFADLARARGQGPISTERVVATLSAICDTDASDLRFTA